MRGGRTGGGHDERRAGMENSLRSPRNWYWRQNSKLTATYNRWTREARKRFKKFLMETKTSMACKPCVRAHESGGKFAIARQSRA